MNPYVLASHIDRTTPGRRRKPFPWNAFLAGVLLGLVLGGLL